MATTRYPVSDAQRATADYYDTTFDALLAQGATIPEAHAYALQAVVDQAQNRVRDELAPETIHERMTA